MHWAHEVAPLADCDVDAGQGRHCALPPVAANEPAEQRLGATEPAMQAVPGGHGVHCNGRVRSVAFEKVPSPHGSMHALPLGQ